MKTLQFVAVSLCVASLALAQGASSDVVVKETTGEAAVVAGNKERAAREAKDKALRDAVEQVAGVMVSSDTLTQNSQLISDRIFANASGYIKSFEVLKQEEKGGVMYVTVKAQVGRAQLDKDLQAVQALVKRLSSKKLLIITQEQAYARDGIIKSSALATELTNALKKDGWEIIDSFAGGGAMELASSVTVGGTPPSEKIANIKSVDYIVYGTAGFRYQEPDGLMKTPGNDPKKQVAFPITGEYDLAVFSTEDGAQLGKIAGKMISGKAGVNWAMSYERTTFDVVKAYSNEISGQIRAAVYESLRNQQVNGKRLNVTVVGISDYTSVQNFSKVLRESITGVSDVGGETKFGGGKAEYEVTFVGSSGDLAERLDGRTFKGKKVSVSKVEKGGVEITLAK